LRGPNPQVESQQPSSLGAAEPSGRYLLRSAALAETHEFRMVSPEFRPRNSCETHEFRMVSPEFPGIPSGGEGQDSAGWNARAVRRSGLAAYVAGLPRRRANRVLRGHGYPPDKQEQATQTVLEQA